MAKAYGKKRTVPHRRKRTGKTDYRKRLTILKSGRHIFVIRKLSNTIMCQIVDYSPDGDKIVTGASSRDLKKLGWTCNPGNTPSAYLAGLLLGVKAKKIGVKSAVLYMGLQNLMKGCCAYAALKGALDAGIDIPYSEDALPSQDRLSGKHIADYAAKLKSDDAAYKKQFGALLKAGSKPEDMNKLFEDIKKKILAM